MPGRDLLVAVCVALLIHTGIFFVDPSRSTTLPRPLTKKHTIEISLCETPRPKPALPKAHKVSDTVQTKKVLRPKPKPSIKPSPLRKPKPRPKPKPEPRTAPKPKPQPKPKLEPVKAQLLPEELTEEKRTDFLEQEVKEVTEKVVVRDIYQEIEIDEAVISTIASLEERDFAVDSSPLLSDTEPSYLHNPKPRYPAVARRRGIEGIVILEVEVLLDGSVGHVALKRSSGFGPLDRSAIRAVKKWIFLPATCNGVSSKAWVNIPVRFELGG